MHDHWPAALEREGELSAGLMDDVLAIAERLFDGREAAVRRVVDLGSGPGVGTVALARAFPQAAIIAVDNSPAMLDLVAARAADGGHARRVETAQLDLDGDLGTLGPADLVWAAMSIHHASDEVATLRALRSLIEPDGLLCILERSDPLSVACTDDLGRPGLWDRLAEAMRQWFEHVRPRMPGAMKAEVYPAMLAAAGLHILVDCSLTRAVSAPSDPLTHEFIAGVLARSVTNLEGFAAEDDLRALRVLVDEAPSSRDAWAGAEVTISRKVYIARKAALPVRADSA